MLGGIQQNIHEWNLMDGNIFKSAFNCRHSLGIYSFMRSNSTVELFYLNEWEYIVPLGWILLCNTTISIQHFMSLLLSLLLLLLLENRNITNIYGWIFIKMHSMLPSMRAHSYWISVIIMIILAVSGIDSFVIYSGNKSGI